MRLLPPTVASLPKKQCTVPDALALCACSQEAFRLQNSVSLRLQPQGCLHQSDPPVWLTAHVRGLILQHEHGSEELSCTCLPCSPHFFAIVSSHFLFPLIISVFPHPPFLRGKEGRNAGCKVGR